MPTYVIGTGPDAGAAGAAAAQLLAFTAFGGTTPTFLFDVHEAPPRPGVRPRGLFRSLPVLAALAPAVISEFGPNPTIIVRVQAKTAETLGPLLSMADAVVLCGTRMGRDLDDGVALYGEVSDLGVRGASGRVLEPWLLPVGWACTRSPGTRLGGWRSQIERRAPQGLRCLPLVLPWSEPVGLLMAGRSRVQRVGQTLLDHLAAIADGRLPERPAAGLAGGDPWPDRPVPTPPRPLFPGLHPLRLVHTSVQS